MLRPGRSRPWVIAHRGASAACPENTVPAFDAALADRCDAVELDVQLSADGIPVVFHDRTLRRLGLPRVRVRDRVLADLRRLDAGAWFDAGFRGQRLLTLEQVLRRYVRRTRLLVELKVRERDRADGHHRRLAAAIAAVLQTHDPDRRSAVLSFDAEALSVVREARPGVTTVRNLRVPRRVGPGLRAELDAVDMISADRRTLTPDFARAWRERGKPLLVFTCNTAPAVRRALASGVDGIMSDRPGWLRDLVSVEPR